MAAAEEVAGTVGNAVFPIAIERRWWPNRGRVGDAPCT
jgi:hypothetical protein